MAGDAGLLSATVALSRGGSGWRAYSIPCCGEPKCCPRVPCTPAPGICRTSIGEEMGCRADVFYCLYSELAAWARSHVGEPCRPASGARGQRRQRPAPAGISHPAALMAASSHATQHPQAAALPPPSPLAQSPGSRRPPRALPPPSTPLSPPSCAARAVHTWRTARRPSVSKQSGREGGTWKAVQARKLE